MDKLGTKIQGGNDFSVIISGNTEAVKEELKYSKEGNDYKRIIEDENKFDHIGYYIYIPHKLKLKPDVLEFVITHEKGHIELGHVEDCHSSNLKLDDDFEADKYATNIIGVQKVYSSLIELDKQYKNVFGIKHGIPHLNERLDNILISSGLGLDDDLNN